MQTIISINSAIDLRRTDRHRSGELPPDDISGLACHVLTVDAQGGSRRSHAESQLSALPLRYEFVDGIDASRHTEPSLINASSTNASRIGPSRSDRRPSIDNAVYSRWRNRLYMKRSMTEGEIAVYMGHRRIWQRIVDGDADAAMVLEDDFTITCPAAFMTAVSAAVVNGSRWDIVKLFDYRNNRKIVRRSEWGGGGFVQYRYPSSGCVAYLINRESCRRLLARTRLARPVDVDLSHPWEFGLRTWSLQSGVVGEAAASLGGSLLEPQRQTHRSTLRSIYGNVLSMNKLIRSAIYHRQLSIENG